MSLYSNHFQQPTIFYASITTPVPYDIYLEKNKQHTRLLLRFSNDPAEDLHIELGQIYWLETSSIRSTLMDIFNPSIWESIHCGAILWKTCGRPRLGNGARPPCGH